MGANQKITKINTPGITNLTPQVITVSRSYNAATGSTTTGEGVDDNGQRVSVLDFTSEGPAFRDASAHFVIYSDIGGGVAQNAPWNSEVISGVVGAATAFDLTVPAGHSFVLGRGEFVSNATSVAHGLNVLRVLATTVLVVLDSIGGPISGDVLRQAKPTAGAINGAGDMMIWVLERTNLEWNRGRWEGVRGFLNAYKV